MMLSDQTFIGRVFATKKDIDAFHKAAEAIPKDQLRDLVIDLISDPKEENK